MGRARRLEFALAAGLLAWAAPARALKIERLRSLRPGAAAAVDVEVTAEEALIRFDPAVSAEQRAAALAGIGGRVLQELSWIGWTHVSLPPGMSVASGLGILRGLPGVLRAEPNYVSRPVRVPSDPQVLNQYHLSKIGAYAAWEYEVGTSSRVTVAVIDAGIQGNHPDLQDKLSGFSHQRCLPGCSDEVGGIATYACNHGTRVAGIAAAATDNGAQVAGVSWQAKILSLRVFDPSGCTEGCGGAGCATDDAHIINAISHVVNLNAALTGKKIINISLGQLVSCPAPMQTAIDAAEAAGVLIVVSAGNDGPGNDTVRQPANCANVLPVGATDSNDNIPTFSSRGPQMGSGGVVAPGVNIVTTDINSGTTGSATGTSFAAPLVAGLAALIRSAKPDFTPAQVRSTLRSSTESIGPLGLGVAADGQPLGNTAGAGRVSAFRAVRLAVNGTLADFEGDQKAIAAPNPFRPSQHGVVTIHVPISLQGRNADIRIYTMDGQLVRKLVGGAWDGTNEHGVFVASGVYLFTVKTDNGLQRGRVAVLR